MIEREFLRVRSREHENSPPFVGNLKDSPAIISRVVTPTHLQSRSNRTSRVVHSFLKYFIASVYFPSSKLI